MPTITKHDLEDAYNWIDIGGVQNEAWLCLSTGKVYLNTDDPGVFDMEFEVPDDLYDSDDYIQIPDKYELDLGSRLVFRFTDAHMPDRYEDVQDIFRRKGAYRRFRNLLEREDKESEWYAFRDASTEEALLGWCHDHGIEVVENESNGDV